MGGVEQVAVAAIVDVQRAVLHQLDAGEDGGRLGNHRAARFAPQLGVHGDRHLLEHLLDDLDVELKVRRRHARVGRREAAADIDDVHDDARFADDAEASSMRVAEGRRVHALRADVERHAEIVGIAARLLEKGWSRRLGDAELVRQRIHRVGVVDGDAPRAWSSARCVAATIFSSSASQSSEKHADAMLEVGALDSLARLHRVHERHLRVWIARSRRA